MNNSKYNKGFIEKYIEPVRKIASNMPQTVSIEVTTRCQLDCTYCTRDKNNPKDLTIENLDRLLEHLKGIKKIVICGMGESFCFPNLYEAIFKLKSFKISIITNGAVPINYDKLNREGNVELLVFSIDATTEEKMESICRSYNFKVLENNITNLRKYPNIIGIINTTINESNIDEIPKLVELAWKYNLQAVNYELPIGDEEFVLKNKSLIRKRIRQAAESAKKYNIIFNNFYRLNCNANGSIIPNIRINGDMFSCCNGMNQNKKIGNIYEKYFDDIWRDRAVSLLHSQDFCLECKLTKNLMSIVE